MKKLIYILIPLMLVSLFLLGCQESITPGLDKGPSAQAGNSNIGHLYLCEKEDFYVGGWNIVEGGAWGKMTYTLSGDAFEFVFNGHGLEAGEDYTLIYYRDPWPGRGLRCLGDGTANKGGNVNIKGEYPTDVSVTDAKIWLVLSDDVRCEGPTQMIGWNPEEYLFEYDLIDFN